MTNLILQDILNITNVLRFHTISADGIMSLQLKQ
jgi:hypothetical protein